jgi:hypothetical protein
MMSFIGYDKISDIFCLAHVFFSTNYGHHFLAMYSYRTIYIMMFVLLCHPTRTLYPDSEPTNLLFLLNAACLAEKQQIPIL